MKKCYTQIKLKIPIFCMAFQKRKQDKNKENKDFLSGFFYVAMETCIISFFLLLGVLIAENFYSRYQEVKNSSVKLGVSYPRPVTLKTVVLGEETETSSFKEPVSRSENYQIKQVSFGGDVLIPIDDSQNRKLEIEDVTSEILTTSNQEEIKVFVSWKTNKPAASTIDYGKDLDISKETIKEESFGFEHSAILSGLDYSSAYSYKIRANDRWNNELDSKEFAFYTGAPKISFIDLLFGAFSDVFSWAIKV
jgi:hypothetical protein